MVIGRRTVKQGVEMVRFWTTAVSGKGGRWEKSEGHTTRMRPGEKGRRGVR